MFIEQNDSITKHAESSQTGKINYVMQSAISVALIATTTTTTKTNAMKVELVKGKFVMSLSPSPLTKLNY